MTPEATEHSNVCKYLKRVYPDIIFLTDLSGIRLTMGQATAIKHLKSSRALPDIIILEPRAGKHGLCLEMKTKDFVLVTKDGFLTSHKKKEYRMVGGARVCIGETDHIKEQYDMLCRLTKLGYAAHFAQGFDIAKKIIDEYLK